MGRDELERHDLVGEQGPDFESGPVENMVEPRCQRCDRPLENGTCPVHGPPCSHLHTLVRREPPSWASNPYPAVLIEECEDCGDIVASRLVERPKGT